MRNVAQHRLSERQLLLSRLVAAVAWGCLGSSVTRNILPDEPTCTVFYVQCNFFRSRFRYVTHVWFAKGPVPSLFYGYLIDTVYWDDLAESRLQEEPGLLLFRYGRCSICWVKRTFSQRFEFGIAKRVQYRTSQSTSSTNILREIASAHSDMAQLIS